MTCVKCLTTRAGVARIGFCNHPLIHLNNIGRAAAAMPWNRPAISLRDRGEKVVEIARALDGEIAILAPAGRLAQETSEAFQDK